MQEHLIKSVETISEKYGKDRLIFIGLYGSQNYNLDYEDSDFDFKAIIVPSLNDIILNKKPVSTTVEIEDGLCDVKDLRTMMNCWKKQNVNFVELLFSKAMWIHPEYKDSFQPLLDNKEKIVHYDEKHAINCIKGMTVEKYHALFKPYPSQIYEIEKHGYAAKQLSHILRLKDLLEKYVSKKSYSECLTSDPLTRDILIKIKNYTYIICPEQVEHLALAAMDSINKIAEDFEPAPIEERTGQIMDAVTSDIIRKALKKELSEDLEG
jgi:predicted nucleotidyltransferase